MKKRIFSVALVAMMACSGFTGCEFLEKLPFLNSGNEESSSSSAPIEYVNPELEIAFLGDSITAGVGGGGQTFSELMKAKDYVTGTQNLGISGSTIGNFSSPFVNRYKNINATADVIFVFGGTNDYGSGGDQRVKLGKMGDKTANTFYGALDVLICGILDNYPDADLNFITPMQRDDSWWGFPSTSPYNKDGYTLKQYRDAVIEMCEWYELDYLDFYNLEGVRLTDSTFKSYMHDGLHPNQAGHNLLTKEIDSFLRAEYSWPEKR